MRQAAATPLLRLNQLPATPRPTGDRRGPSEPSRRGEDGEEALGPLPLPPLRQQEEEGATRAARSRSGAPTRAITPPLEAIGQYWPCFLFCASCPLPTRPLADRGCAPSLHRRAAAEPPVNNVLTRSMVEQWQAVLSGHSPLPTLDGRTDSPTSSSAAAAKEKEAAEPAVEAAAAAAAAAAAQPAEPEDDSR